MAPRIPGDKPRPAIRLKGALKAGAATSNGGILYEIVPTRGSSRMRVRIKTATNGGSIDLIPVGPDFDPDQTVAFGSLTGTLYTSGLPTQVGVTAGTETKIDLELYGENYVIVKFTGTVGAGTITFVDVSQV
jgi:hypothetical protein